MRALNVTMEEVCDALYEGNELPAEFLQTLLKMAPTTDEQLKLRLFTGELSQLGPADQFLKAMVDMPFAFKRMEALLFMSTLKEELNSTIESFAVLESTDAQSQHAPRSDTECELPREDSAGYSLTAKHALLDGEENLKKVDSFSR
ncbi:formin-like protein 5 isoform X1 [Arachis hypogaea]|uniref:formin-like protein 5 isoform X1 n=1 Tax=Arachis hypogaea TaxID=3818 RepID=UPI000DEC2959|nr:formin-like protein 5 isoform X1 [Arachis hypogaea]XP_025633891.1 formin-like protein 5 isoform X1 [Arachis hypogaea]XP_025633892.1 formin-like protein 5 isoform X1 [Arachis hypogaea]XP_025633893.1 formin-like protein 5 isoform X1 [Arachis hypogaea]XP_025633899.1 formin-like protein 5 isoform X1 [Arachis hypogaea]XP_025633900.1 formin-like protein 5 isoform X1 [Arachis hypogaea]XP_025633901.1 formin-like protein 5 isoform X1 [Arachis hypogaea]